MCFGSAIRELQHLWIGRALAEMQEGEHAASTVTTPPQSILPFETEMRSD